MITMNLSSQLAESLRRLKRFFDGYFSYKRMFALLLCFTVCILYIGPFILRWFYSSPHDIEDYASQCMEGHLKVFYSKNDEYNANIKHWNIKENEKDYLPYIGNGVFGLPIENDAHLNIKSGRTLSIPVYFHPLASLSGESNINNDATVVDYLTGIVHRFQCSSNGYSVSYEYYAHRTLPSVFVQEIHITNPSNINIDIELAMGRISDWDNAKSQVLKIQHGSSILEYQMTTGYVTVNLELDLVVVVCVVSRKPPHTIQVRKGATVNLELLLTIDYSEPVVQHEFANKKDFVEKRAVNALKYALSKAQHEGREISKLFKEGHINVWNKIWATGFTISDSKALGAINGDKINATMYSVLSQVRSFEYEEQITESRKNEITRSLTYAEGCFDGYHTLQAVNLWKDLKTLSQVNNVARSWLLTLEKQGCHNLIKAGASGVVQAMVLSFGGLRFSNQHLEFNIHPKHLHRNYDFKRLNYGNLTHVNVSVSVGEDNKAVLFVALDRSDKNYYACDAGCLDEPVQLGPTRRQFPVKVTEPLTAILYIASDKEHMEDLQHAIHVMEVLEAPAHEHHVIAMHKHGHQLGGLPTLFWLSIILLIIIFHIFLCKLVVAEYCNPPDKYRTRYNKRIP